MRFSISSHGVCLLMLVFATSCDKDVLLDDQLVGSWGWIDRAEHIGTLDTVAYYETPAISGCGERMDLSDNGRYYWTYENCVDPGDEEGDESGKWHVNSAKTKIYFGEGTGDQASATYVFAGDTLVLTKSYTDIEVQFWIVEKWRLK